MSVTRDVEKGVATNDSKPSFERLVREGREAEQREREKDRLKKERKYFEKSLTSFLKNLYMENFYRYVDISIEDFYKRFNLSQKECKEYIEEIINTDNELVKNKKDLGKKFTGYDINRNFFSELGKNEADKDISLLEEKLINLIYEKSKEEIKVDYRSNFYICEAGELKKLLEAKNKKYKFLINLEKLSKQLIKAFELVKYEALAKCSITLVRVLHFKYINKEILPNIKDEIIYEENKKIKFYKYLLLCIHVYYILNEEKAYLKMLDTILDLNIMIPIENKIIGNEDIKKPNSFLRKVIYNKENKRDNLFLNKMKSIEVFYLTSNDDVNIVNKMIRYKEQLLTPELVAAYYRGVYLSDIKYKGNKISSYLENYRKAEFILQIHERVEAKILTQADYIKLKNFYLTEKEAKNEFSKKKKEEIFERRVDPYSIEKEENFIRAILKIGNSVDNIEDKLEELHRITTRYLKIKKSYGAYQEVTGIKRDIITLINYIYHFYYEANIYSGIDIAEIRKKEVINYLKKREKRVINFIVKKIKYTNILSKR